MPTLRVIPARLRRSLWGAGVTAVALMMVACGGGQPRAQRSASPKASPTLSPSSPIPSPSPPPPEADLGKVSMKATPVAPLDQPISLAYRKDDSRLYFAQRAGKLVAVKDGKLEPNALLDISGEVSFASEQGFLGVAISPDGSHLYINYTNKAGDTRVDEFAFKDGNPDPGSRRNVLAQDQPFVNHNGGNLVFGPDGRLWIGLGDGGSQGDPRNNAQSLGTFLGKMLRINPAASGGSPYGIPPDNPFVNRQGAKPEIWAIGLRNPWRYTFDRMTKDLWIGDVGQYVIEEIDFTPAGSGAGGNYGWSLVEGNRRFKGPAPAGATAPIHTYNHDGGRCAVVGGYVYRGSKIPNLNGAYLYSDNCDGRIRGLVQKNGGVTGTRDFDLVVPRLSSFAEGPDGELYLMSLTQGLFRLDPA
jgi:glucose/arabinose dehydrogenase